MLYMKVMFSYQVYFLVREGLSTDDVGCAVWQGAPCFRRYGRGLVSKPAISLRKILGGAKP